MYLDGSSTTLDINNIPHNNPLFQHRLVDRRVQPKLFSPSHGFETDDDVRDGFAVPAQGVLRLGGCEFGDFAFVDFFGFFDSEA